MTNSTSTETAPHPHERQPFRVRLPGFISEQDVGLGDAVKKATALFGLKPCGGCEQRAALLNQWLIFTGRPQR